MADEQTNDTRSRIFAAAETLFCQHGYDGVSIRDVARRADVNKASVFYYFSSKDQLFEEVLESYYEAHRRALRQALDADGSVRERMHRLIDDYWSFISEDPRYSKLAQGLLLSGDRHMDFLSEALGTLFDWTVDALSEISPAKGPRAARQLHVTFVGAVVHYFNYAPALASRWHDDPMAAAAIEERRAHLHWLVDLVLDDLIERRDEHTQ